MALLVPQANASPFEPFHFDTNPFLNEGGASAIDFHDLFRLLKEDGGAEGLEAGPMGAGLDCPQGSEGLADSPASSTGWVASPTPAGAAPLPAAPAVSLATAAAPSARQAARNDTKAATDTTKRSREAAQIPKSKVGSGGVLQRPRHQGRHRTRAAKAASPTSIHILTATRNPPLLMSHAVNAIAPPAQQNQLKELEALAAQKAEEVERLLRQNSELKFRCVRAIHACMRGALDNVEPGFVCLGAKK